MLLLVVGLLLFFLLHLLRELGLRDRVIAGFPSKNAYLGAYSLLTLLGLALIIIGKAQAEFSMVWEPRFEWRNISHFLMLPAFILIVAGNVPPSLMRANLRNPMLLGTFLWGIAHLWANGDLASMLLFGGFTVWAGVKFISLGINYQPPAKAPSIVWDGIAIAIGLVLYGLVAIYHGQLFGVGLSFAQ
ncbi:MAG: NnrU family protein [Pseudomonadales bacterium]|nr:NnrU family protein [Pseudomonadales bacterium]